LTPGVSRASPDIDYTSGVRDGTYVDPANPTAAEIQTVVDSVNAATGTGAVAAVAKAIAKTRTPSRPAHPDWCPQCAPASQPPLSSPVLCVFCQTYHYAIIIQPPPPPPPPPHAPRTDDAQHRTAHHAANAKTPHHVAKSTMKSVGVLRRVSRLGPPRA